MLLGIIEEIAFLDAQAEHLLQRHGLGTDLHAILVPRFRFSAFVLDRSWHPKAFFIEKACAIFTSVKFDYIADAGQTQPRTRYSQSSKNKKIAPSLSNSLVMASFVHLIASNRKAVLRPLLLDMNERPLPGAKRVVLNPRQWQVLVFLVYGVVRHTYSEGRIQSNALTSTPSGTLSWATSI